MAIELHDAVNGDGLFDVLGKAFFAIDTLNTGRASSGTGSIPAEVLDFIAQFQLVAASTNPKWQQAMAGVGPATSSWQSSGSTLTNAISQACQQLLIRYVTADATTVSEVLTPCLQYLIDQMAGDGDYVTGPTTSVGVTPGGSNIGDAVLAATLKRGDGLACDNCLAETITVTVTSDTSTTAPTITITSPVTVSDRLSQDWPGGSGLNLSITATNSTSSLLTNGNFATNTIANVPDGWTIAVGVPGTSVKVSVPEQQTVAIAGTPTGGHYILKWTNAAGIERATENLAYNATSATVQTALRAIPGLELATVTSSGTSPNLTHTIVFTGVGGNPAQLTSVNSLTGGTTPTITHATTVAGDASSYSGHSLVFIGDATENTTIYLRLPTLAANTVYFLGFRVRRSGASTGTTIDVEVVNEIGGTATQDAAGGSNALTFETDDIGTSAWTDKTLDFRVTPETSQPVWLRIKATDPVPSGCSMYFDEFALVQGRELYSGGPLIAVFTGYTPSVNGDTWSVVVANDRGGEFQEWFNRCFGMADKGLLLPTSGGGDLIDDALIA